MKDLFRRLPGVDQLLDESQIQGLITDFPKTLVLKAIRQTLEELRIEIRQFEPDAEPPDISIQQILKRIDEKTQALARPNLSRVVNATGVIIHTNLGRSCLSEEALQAVETAGRFYSNLEFNLSTGERGSRYSLVEEILCDLTGAEAGLVVNNNAAAVLLTLNSLARDKEVIISRGELVEIGGSFRIPEVMAASGAIMIEVGATNKTHLFDYERAVTDRTAVLLKVHQSNFHMVGFTEQVSLQDLAEFGRTRGLPVVEDLGSGSFIDFSAYGLRREPTVKDTISSGAALVTFSGDKLLGGPQAGIILGRKEFVNLLKTNPLNRALRIDKFTLASLEASLRLYLDEEKALERIPTLKMITAGYPELRAKAVRLKRKLVKAAGNVVEVTLMEGFSRIGGGSLPVQELKTSLIAMRPHKMSVNALEEWFRSQPIPIIGRIEKEKFMLDVRTMRKEDEAIVINAVSGLAGEVSNEGLL